MNGYLDCVYVDPDFPTFYPLNASLQEEMKRLFSQDMTPYKESVYNTIHVSSEVSLMPESTSDLDYVQQEFRMNGKDSEYCPESSSSHSFQLNKLGRTISATSKPRKRQKKNDQGCVFCKNNGEEERFYRRHILKNSEGKITCPILKAYTCPICGANGDIAHTIKYCPQNTNTDEIPIMITLKSHLSATGQRRIKSIC